MKKFALLLALIMVICCVPAMAAKTVTGELLVNGDMELCGTSMDPWTHYSSGCEKSTYVAHSGTNSVKSTKSEGKTAVLTQDAEFIGGGLVNMSAWVYTEEANKTAGWKFYYFDKDGNAIKNEQNMFQINKDKWTYISAESLSPEGAVRIQFQLRNGEFGTLYFDDVSVKGEATQMRLDEVKNKNEKGMEVLKHSQELYDANIAKSENATLGGNPNLIGNPGFEEVGSVTYEDETGKKTTLEVPKDWNAFSRSKWGEIPQYVTDVVHSGERAVKISNYDESLVGNNPWVMYTVETPTKANNQYMVSAWVKKADNTENCGFFFKVEMAHIDEDGTSTGIPGVTSNKFYFNDTDWHEIKHVFSMPEGANKFHFYARLSGTGTVYYDDVQFGLADTMEVMNMKSDRVFYYTEEPTGLAYAEINDIRDGAYVQFEIKDGENVLASQQVPASGKAVWNFETAALRKKQQEYTLAATYYAADGTVLAPTQTKGIYRYDRPPVINDKGQYIIDGKPADPFFIYGAWDQFLEGYASVGIKFFRPRDPKLDTWDTKELLKVLDRVDKLGMKMMICLYSDQPAGHPFQIDNTRRVVETVKDHPAVAGYLMMDEPSYAAKGNFKSAQTYEEMHEYLVEGYKAIRDIDPVHPVINIDTVDVTDETIEMTSQVTDVFMIDSYPLQPKDIPIRMYNATSRVMKFLKEDHPFWTLGCQWTDTETPMGDEGVISSMYQTFFAGAQGFGYYTSDKDSAKLIENMKPSYESGEMGILFDHFSHGEGVVFNHSLSGKYFYRSWVLDDGTMYLAIMDNTYGGEDTQVEIPLTSTNGKVKITSFTAELVNGGDTYTVTGDDGVFKMTMKPTQTSLYKITPAQPVDTSLLSANTFDDMAEASWAADAVELLWNAGIVNKKGDGIFAPNTNITRGDFAMFLIRTMGITDAGSASQFADVDPNAEYAAEVLIGKNLGIFKGSGNNMFEPETEISRQDMMTMCARALGLAGGVDLGRFTDNALIADYARDSIAAMVKAEIVKGNPDGSVNPLGNTTRAEAAVIMERILNLD
ncbi:MAG: S-layer homology domain-containing protein [Clostridia bacterium]|nr:S-layer homology domain-containing protein [Clostridia bacterium]